MYVGGPNSSPYRTVKGVASKSPKKGDKYCTGGTCTAPGDSGGPIYTVSSGKVVAKGIHSGGGK